MKNYGVKIVLIQGENNLILKKKISLQRIIKYIGISLGQLLGL